MVFILTVRMIQVLVIPLIFQDWIWTLYFADRDDKSFGRLFRVQIALLLATKLYSFRFHYAHHGRLLLLLTQADSLQICSL